jgi:hypothetical protein
MANEHPFHFLFETLGRLPSAHAESVNWRASQQLLDTLTVPVFKTGRCILLKAPRAGHGKTHLLSRVQHQLGNTHEFIQLQATYGTQVDAASVIDDTLRRLLRHLPASGGLCVLDLVVRRLLATALQPLVASGEVPCQDREGAITALKRRPIETFDFHHPNAITAHWTRENFEVLGQRFSIELSQRIGLPFNGVTFWINELFRFASAPLDNPSRLQVLAEAVRKAPGAEIERLQALLGLLSSLMRVVLVADDLEGFSSDSSAALKLAAFLGTLRESVECLDVILSVNEDIWSSAFLPRLSGGLADRLSEVTVQLEPLTETEMSDLLDSRVPGLGHRVLQHIDISFTGTHARGVIRAAGHAWLKATTMDSMQAGIELPQAPVMEPIPATTWAASYVPDEADFAQAEPEAPHTTLAAEPETWPAPMFISAPEQDVSSVSVPITASTWDAFQQISSPNPPPIVEQGPMIQAPPETYVSVPLAWNTTPVEAPSAWQLNSPVNEAIAPTPSVIKAVEVDPFTRQEPAAPTAVLVTAAPVNDLDRVDDLLRQFRERYGRGEV